VFVRILFKGTRIAANFSATLLRHLTIIRITLRGASQADGQGHMQTVSTAAQLPSTDLSTMVLTDQIRELYLMGLPAAPER